MELFNHSSKQADVEPVPKAVGFDPSGPLVLIPMLVDRVAGLQALSIRSDFRLVSG